MDFYEVVKNRRSIRSFKDTEVPHKILERIAGAAQLAPTACNKQPFKVLFIKDPAVREKITSKYMLPWLSEAPLLAVILGNGEEAWHRKDGGDSAIDIDCGILIQTILLSATAENLASCCVCAFDRKRVDEALGLDETAGYSSVAIIPLGYANDTPAPVKHKGAQDLFEVI